MESADAAGMADEQFVVEKILGKRMEVSLVAADTGEDPAAEAEKHTTQLIRLASAVSNEGPRSRVLVPLPAVSWPWVLAWGSLEPPRRGGGDAQKTGKNGEKMGEIQPKMCEGREALVQQLQWLGGRVRRRTEYKLPKFSTKTEEKVARNLQFSPALISPLVRHPRGRPNQTINWQLWAGGQVGRWAGGHMFQLRFHSVHPPASPCLAVSSTLSSGRRAEEPTQKPARPCGPCQNTP